MVYQTNSRQDTLIKNHAKFVDESTQRVTASLKMLGSNIEHSAKNNYRPYLMLYGEVAAVAFPNGKYQQFFPSTHVHVRYEFSDEELAQLSAKGLFYDGFRCPEIISDNPNVEIPMEATARRYSFMGNLYVTLDLAAADIYETDTRKCGYIFADYFEEQIPAKLDTKLTGEEKDAIPVFEDDDAFAEQFASELEAVSEKELSDNKPDMGFTGERIIGDTMEDKINRLYDRSSIVKRQHKIAEDANKETDVKPAQAEDDDNFDDFLQAQEELMEDFAEFEEPPASRDGNTGYDPDDYDFGDAFDKSFDEIFGDEEEPEPEEKPDDEPKDDKPDKKPEQLDNVVMNDEGKKASELTI